MPTDEMEVIEGQGSEKTPWDKVSTVEALVEVSRPLRAIERQSELLLELVKLQQGNLVEEMERKPGEIQENGLQVDCTVKVWY